MLRFDVAAVREQGADLLIVVVGHSFGYRSPAAQNGGQRALQARASRAGLPGTVVPVWNDGGRMGFLAPRQCHPFFRSIGLGDVARNVNHELSCWTNVRSQRRSGDD